MDNLSLGLGASGVGGVILMIIGWFVARGIHSRCVAGGNVIEVDVHRATPAELTGPPSDTVEVKSLQHLQQLPDTHRFIPSGRQNPEDLKPRRK